MHRLGWTVIAALLVVLASTALPGAAQVSQTQEKEEPGQPDESPVELVIEPTQELTQGVNSQGNALIHVTARIDTEPLLLSVQLAGAVRSGERAAQWYPIAESESLRRDLVPRDHFAMRLEAMPQGQSRVIELPVSFPEPGHGYLLANIRSPIEGTRVLLSESYVLYTLTDDGRVYFSPRSLTELDRIRLEERVTHGLSEASGEELEQLERQGAQVIDGEPPPAMEPLAEAAPQAPNVPATVTVEGRIMFTDVQGKTHPVRFVTVEVWDERTGNDKRVATTKTDGNGKYSVTVNNDDGNGTGLDLYVIAKAEGETVRVVNAKPEGPPQGPQGEEHKVWAIDSFAALKRDVPNGTTLTLSLVANNERVNNVAFEAYEAANVLSRYLLLLGEPKPRPVTIRYPEAGDGSSYLNDIIYLAGTDVHDWDNIHHEYGHHLQAIYGISSNVGGAHSPGDNLCRRYTRDQGLKLAWGEAWPTFFGILAQKEMKLDAWGIPSLGDTRYTDVKPGGAPLSYDLEVPDGDLLGEGDEGSIQLALWDLYDTLDDPGDTGIALSARDLWRVVKRSHPQIFSDFYRAFADSYPEPDQITYGSVLARHKIGSELVAPEDDGTFSNPFPEFSWTGNLGCGREEESLFEVRFYDEESKKLLWYSGWQSASTLAVTLEQASEHFKGYEGIRWVVRSRDDGQPKTGIYYGQSRKFRAEFPNPGAPQTAGTASPTSGQ